MERKYRVLRQTLSMHAQLKDGYSRKARATDVILLLCSVVFCATTFAQDRLFLFFGLSPDGARIALGLASILAFAGSLFGLIMGWKGKAARHQDAVEIWSRVLGEFREAKSEGSEGLLEHQNRLSQLYWEANRNAVAIPEFKFNKLKARYLVKVQLSQMISRYPGCPRIVLWLIVRFQGMASAVRECGVLKKDARKA